MKIRKKKRVDEAHDITDRELYYLEIEIERIYDKSFPQVATEWSRFMKDHAKDLDKPLADLKKAIILGGATEIALAKTEYQRQAQRLFMGNGDFRRMSEKVAAKITKMAAKAIQKANNALPYVYTINYNALDGQIKRAKVNLQYSFNLVNEDAVKRLAKSNQILLPKRDIAWNEKMINSQVMQGIQNGESIPQIAKRLRNVADMSKSASIRNARTMVTAVENLGRLDSYRKAESDGVILKKTWICVHDNRVRNWHLELDGVTIPIDQPWVNEYGKLMYPGDPSGHPANVYNCRCTMIADVEGFLWR